MDHLDRYKWDNISGKMRLIKLIENIISGHTVILGTCLGDSQNSWKILKLIISRVMYE